MNSSISSKWLKNTHLDLYENNEDLLRIEEDIMSEKENPENSEEQTLEAEDLKEVEEVQASEASEEVAK